nr:double-strand break repair protein AddB [Enterovirga sp. DB1703]
MAEPKLFTIPPGTPFLATLADALHSGELVGPLGPDEISAATIYLPTRRAGRALAELLAARARGRGLVLPRIVPLGDADEESGTGGASASADLKPAIPPLERRLILARLVQVWAARVDRSELRLDPDTPFMVPGSPADAVSLAADLEGLMDALATESVDWEALEEVVDIDYSQYFRLTLDFVRIAHELWPGILAERDAMDPAVRRNAVIEAERRRLEREPPAGPVIAAGSTGSIPATARLLATIARLPRGAVVLPGLDLDLDEKGWAAIGGDGRSGGVHGHPQFILRRLVEESVGTARSAVTPLGPRDPALEPRRRLLSEIMRPADTTDLWAEISKVERHIVASEGTDGLVLIEAADEREEALAIAVALRETLATPGRRAALVTPDRSLARRVAAELGRWGIRIADSAGIPLADTAPGRLARLAAEAAALDFQPVQVLALLAHPQVTLGLAREEVERGAAALELGVLRGPAPRPGLDGIAAAYRLRRAGKSRREPLPARILSPEDWDLAAEILQRLDLAFGPFRQAGADGRLVDLVRLAGLHADAVAGLTDLPPGTGRPPDPARDCLDGLFDELAATRVEDGAGRSILGRFSDYPAFFSALARDRQLAPEIRGTHPRIRILGLLEARLIEADRVVLGGLDETIWPPVAETDAFLNRPMRLKLGLTPPERRIGQTAHDFVQALGVRDAIVSRARKRGGKPTVPSRFLERLQAFAGKPVWSEMVARGDRYRRLAAALDTPRPVPPLRRPEPQPGPERFPRKLSVTEIETLVRDPYAIFARHVLRLEPLDPIAVQPSAAERGTILHEIVGGFAAAHPKELPADAEAELLQRGADRFGPIEEAYPELYALWWPAFVRFVPAYLEWERKRRARLSAIHVERSGQIAIPIADGDVFMLRARADRIEYGTGSEAVIIDFKSGRVPSDREVAVGFSPQLTLEAAMLMRGGFDRVPAAEALPVLEYVKIGGRELLRERAVETPKKDGRSIAALVEEHLEGLEKLVRRYAVEGAGYRSRPYPQYARAHSPYDHLARVKEWSATAGADDAGGER